MDAKRLVAVLVADLRARIRRRGVALLMGLSALAAVLIIPDPRPGSGLVMVAGARALYTSSTLALATATLLSFALSFFGFFVVRGALEHDARARLAHVLAASPVRSSEYLLAKLLGSIALLATVATGFVAAAMAMQVVRGEGPLEPGTYLLYFGTIALPGIVWVAVLALVFECTPGLAGRLGDVLYFLVWSASATVSVVGWKSGGPVRLLDAMGMGFVIHGVERVAGTGHFSIGYAPGDPAQPPIELPGLQFPAELVGLRVATAAVPLVLVPLALVLFRRFDPARTRTRGAGGSRASALLQRLSAAVMRPALAPLSRVAPDVALSLRAHPSLGLAAIGLAIAALVLPSALVRAGVLPAVFALVSLSLADVATREREAGLRAIVFSTPGRREGFVAWKLGTALGLAALVGGLPALRVLVAEPSAGVSALVGLAFLACAAVALGVASGTPKVFVGVALALWYLAVNARTGEPALDYGGFWARATPAVQAGWLLAALVAAALAVAAHRRVLAREG